MKECVKAGMAIPFGGGLVGGKTWSGEQCYQCVDKPDRCSNKFPGTSWLAACQANCAAPKFCMKVGNYQGNGCFRCVEPPEDCKDIGVVDMV